MISKSLFQRRKLPTACLTALAIICCQLQAGIQIKKVNSEQASFAVRFSDIEGHSILQRSNDLISWQDLFLVGPELNGVLLPDPASKVERKLFYRLKTIDTNFIGEMHVNPDPSASHLMTYRRGPDIELHLFGARDESGLPLRITDSICRIGNTSYSMASSMASPPSQINTGQTTFASGYVYVKIDPDCPTANSPPSIEWRVTQFLNPSGLPQDTVSGQRQTTLAPPDIQEDGYNVYAYSIPASSRGYPVPPAPNPELWFEIYGQWVTELILPQSFLDLTKNSVEFMAEKEKVIPGKFVKVAGAAGTLASIALATMAAQTAAENYDFGPPSTFGAYDAKEIEARVLIADGIGTAGVAGGFSPITPWEKFEPNTLGIGPEFRTADPCPVRTITITKGYSVSIPGNTDFTQSFDFSQVLDPNLVIVEQADWSIDYKYSDTVVKTELGERTARSGQIDRAGFIWIEAASNNSGKIIPPPAPNHPSVNNAGGVWNHQSTIQYIHLNAPNGPLSFIVPGDAVKLKMIDTNPVSLSQYFDPLRVSVSGWSSHSGVSYIFASTPPLIIDSTPLNVAAAVSIKIYYRKR